MQHETARTNEDKAQAALDERIDRAWSNIVYTDDGRRVLWSILAMCGIYTNTFTGRADAAFLEGRRSIGLELLRDRIAAIDPAIYPEMMLKDIEDQERLAAAREIDADDADPLD